MNKKQKALTIVVLLLFTWIGFEHASEYKPNWALLFVTWFMLAVLYLGLFFVLKSSK